MAKGDDVKIAVRPLLTVKPRWGGVLFVCGKCMKRHDDGKMVRHALKLAASRKRLGGGRKPRLVKTACLGLCPKRALVVASPATLASGEVILVRHRDEVAEAVERLLPKP